MIKKQIQKLLVKYFLGSLVLLILAPLFLTVLILPSSANAQNNLGCTIDTSARNVKRGVDQMGITITDKPGTRNQTSGFDGQFQILFVSGSQYRLGGDCVTLVRPILKIVRNVVSTDISNPPVISNTDLPVTDFKAEVTDGKLFISGKFSVPDIAAALQPAVATDIKDNKSAESPLGAAIYVSLIENGIPTYYTPTGGVASGLKFYGCENKLVICQVHGDGSSIDPTAGNDNDLKLNDIKFKLSSALLGDNLQFSPEARKAAGIHNFVRLYIDTDGKIKGFELQSKVFLSQPTDKTLNVNNSGKTSKVYLTTDTKGTIVSKNAMFVGAGVTDAKQPFKTSSDYGCIAGETSTHYIPFTGNVTRAFNLCNPVELKIAKEVALKAGGDGFGFALSLDDAKLRKLKSLKTIKCTDKENGTGCGTEVNEIQIGAILGLEENVVTDSGNPFGKALLGLLTAGTYNLVDGYSMIQQQWNFMNGLPITGHPQSKFYIQIYESKKEWEKNINEPIPESVPLPSEIETSIGTKDVSASQTLYGFITRVISDIIVWLQSVIYFIFASLVVPILNALLHVRPYQDAFVNVIYPGWLILRNLANIFFIVSLLVVGLRILFQLSASGTAVGFIRRLLIMALLVNFSLVISQGIIGIADTVQSQFLPANTKIIESLGQKLMVEPLKNFREEVNNNANSPFTEDQSQLGLSDTIKPLVLLILSIAAFFSFVAVAAFLTVRLVVLWVLYMISPIAYVGFVMEETKKYASQWWSEFIKQAMLAPILVFFLNIAALMATTFSAGGDKGLFKFNPDGSLSGDVVIGSLTILTHFIVLGFLFAGMKFALSFGGIGSKTIVDYAKKGFDNVTKRPAKWAGGVAKDAAKTQWDRNFKSGMLDPFAHRDAFKKNVDDKTKKTMEARLARKENKLTPEGMYKKPFKALKYVLAGGSIAGGIMENEKNALDDESRILTESERQKYENEMDYNTNRLGNATDDLSALDSNRVSHSQVQTDIINELEAKEVSLAQEKAVLEQEATDFNTNGRLADEQKKRDEAALVQEDIDKLSAIRTNIETKLAASVAAGEASVAFDKDTTDEIKVVFNADDAKDKLKKEIAELEGEIKVLDDNDKLKKAFNYDPYQDMTDDNRAELKAKASKLDEEINGHYMPPSLGATNARLAREREYEKNIAHLEGEELRLAFKKAMADNNTDLATAIGKKVAQEGDFDSLLKDYGFKNNAEDLTKFIDQKFGKLSPIVRAQVGSEISTINKKNGNLALGDAYKISEKGHIIARPLEEQLRKVNASAEKKSPDEVLKKGPNGLTYQTAKGHFINQGDINNFNSFKGKRMDNLNKMNYKLAQHLKKAQNFSGLDSRIQAKITEIANKNI